MKPARGAETIRSVLTVGEVAKRSGVAVSALHFYEAKGLLFSHRTAGNQRRYRASATASTAASDAAACPPSCVHSTTRATSPPKRGPGALGLRTRG